MIRNKVAIIGLGYVGLPLAVAIAKNKKYKVVGFDLSKEKIEPIKKGISPIEDAETVKSLKKVSIEVSTDEKIIADSQYIIVCVPTPVKDSKLPDLGPVKSATRTILKFLQKGQYIIIESTINPGVCEEVVLPILESGGAKNGAQRAMRGGHDFELSHCPERINPGDKKWDVNNIPRNIGSLTLKGNRHVANFYRSFLKGEINEVSSIKIAEATKIIENTFRDINIAYVNELAKSFDIMEIDLLETIQAASNKPFAFMPHFPGCGVGGHCIPVDPYYLITRAQKAGFNHSFLRKARQVNNSMPHYTVELLEKNLAKAGLSRASARIGLLGLSYKADIGDLRESPALEIQKILTAKHITFKTFDPHLLDRSDTKTLATLFSWANVILLATSHRAFTSISATYFSRHKIRLVIDGKNCLPKPAIQKAGIIYKGVGH